mmetsp:Transcript_9923/g.21104  ORF Transcript_9923/g.21104 Transcript_9923/m.21104 type:complete len:224 (+) Transcript_9923:137-808(+)
MSFTPMSSVTPKILNFNSEPSQQCQPNSTRNNPLPSRIHPRSIGNEANGVRSNNIRIQDTGLSSFEVSPGAERRQRGTWFPSSTSYQADGTGSTSSQYVVAKETVESFIGKFSIELINILGDVENMYRQERAEQRERIERLQLELDKRLKKDHYRGMCQKSRNGMSDRNGGNRIDSRELTQERMSEFCDNIEKVIEVLSTFSDVVGFLKWERDGSHFAMDENS